MAESISRNDGGTWGTCNGQNDPKYQQDEDVLYDPTDDPLGLEFGDYTHPTGEAVKKVADQLVNFINTSVWVTPWIMK